MEVVEIPLRHRLRVGNHDLRARRGSRERHQRRDRDRKPRDVPV